MSDIQPGDVVVCVDASSRPEWAEYVMDCAYCDLVVGKHYIVREICPPMEPDWPDELGVDVGVPTPNGFMFWGAERFRKIRPADPEFIAIIKRKNVPAPTRPAVQEVLDA